MIPSGVLDLHDLDDGDAGHVGPKLARLGALAGRGWQVPDGYVVSVEALRGWLPPPVRDGLRRVAQAAARLPRPQPGGPGAAPGPDFGGSGPGALALLAEEARQAIEATPLPARLTGAIADAHQRLEARTGAGPGLLVAVRSSATCEDTATASFAGQFDTFLGVSGAAAVTDHVRRCWSSLYAARALDYRLRHGLPADAVELAVGVLQLVTARAAGVVFTLDPVTGDRDVCVVEANWGLGDTVVSGRVTPDQWRVDRASGRVTAEHVGAKTVATIVDPDARQVVERPLPPEQSSRPCLRHDEVRHLCEQALALERQEGVPQDVEWAIDQDRPFPDSLFLLQHRPDTAHAAEAATGPAARPAAPPGRYDPIEYALRNVFKVPGR